MEKIWFELTSQLFEALVNWTLINEYKTVFLMYQNNLIYLTILYIISDS